MSQSHRPPFKCSRATCSPWPGIGQCRHKVSPPSLEVLPEGGLSALENRECGGMQVFRVAATEFWGTGSVIINLSERVIASCPLPRCTELRLHCSPDLLLSLRQLPLSHTRKPSCLLPHWAEVTGKTRTSAWGLMNTQN